MAWGSLLNLIPAANQAGTGAQKRAKGAGSYDLRTGKYYDPGKFHRSNTAMSFLNPIKAASDPDLKGWEKVAAGLGWGGAVAHKARERREAKNAEVGKMYTDIASNIDNLTDYERSPEAREKLSVLQNSGAKMEELSGEATDIARSRASEDLPGAAIERSDINQAVADRIMASQEMSNNALASIVKTGAEGQAAYRGLNKRNLEYKAQAEKDLSRALMADANTKSQSAQMGAAGLQGMVNEGDKVFKSQLDKALTSIDFDINTLATEQMGYSAQAASAAASNAAFTNAAAQIGSTWIANSNSGGSK